MVRALKVADHENLEILPAVHLSRSSLAALTLRPPPGLRSPDHHRIHPRAGNMVRNMMVESGTLSSTTIKWDLNTKSGRAFAQTMADILVKELVTGGGIGTAPVVQDTAGRDDFETGLASIP